MPELKVVRPPAEAEEAEVGGGAPPSAQRRILLVLVGLIVAMLSAYALKITYSVSMPLALAFFLSATVHPVHHAIVRRVPPWLAGLGLLASLLLVMLAVGVLVGAIWLMGELIAPKMPEYADQLEQQWQALKDWARQIGLPLPAPMAGGGDGQESLGNSNLIGAVSGTLQNFASSFIYFMLMLVLALFFMLLMLGEGERWREKTHAALADDWSTRVVDAVGTIARKVRLFLLVRTAASIISGLIAGLWLWLVGLDLALVWGLLFFVLNYIPNIGSILAAIPPILVALLELGPGGALLAAAGLIANEQIVGNYLDPKLQGRNLDISPLVVLVSVIFWGWVWGIVGALIAVPMTVTLLIAFSRVESLRPLALLLSSSADFDHLDQHASRH